MPNQIPDPLAEILRDETLTSGERLHLIEALFVHDPVVEWRRGADTRRVARASRTDGRAVIGRSQPRDSARAS